MRRVAGPLYFNRFALSHTFLSQLWRLPAQFHLLSSQKAPQPSYHKIKWKSFHPPIIKYHQLLYLTTPFWKQSLLQHMLLYFNFLPLLLFSLFQDIPLLKRLDPPGVSVVVQLVKLPLAMLHPISELWFESWLSTSYPVTCLEGSEWLKCLGPCHTYGRPKWGSWPPTLACSIPSCCSSLMSEPVHGKYFSMCLPSAFQANL